jgi:threonine/homoserine/homoserine lactone efflux protein
MSIEQYLAMFAFAFAMSATPGPNTMMLLASGVNFGFRATVPHMVGIPFGLVTMMIAVGLGLGALLAASPLLDMVMKSASIAYMLWLAWGIAKAGTLNEGPSRSRPMSMIEAALFQWINPKAWAMALTGASAYTVRDHYTLSLSILTATLLVISLPVTAAWTGLGVSLRQVLSKPGTLRMFNLAMALILVASLWPLVREFWR